MCLKQNNFSLSYTTELICGWRRGYPLNAFRWAGAVLKLANEAVAQQRENAKQSLGLPSERPIH